MQDKKQVSEETLLILEAIHKLGTAIENLTYAVDHLRPDPAVEFEDEEFIKNMYESYDPLMAKALHDLYYVSKGKEPKKLKFNFKKVSDDD